VARYYTPEEFAELKVLGLSMGFSHVESSPLTRSSYHAWDQVTSARGTVLPAFPEKLGKQSIDAVLERR
jgi:hypothetical protein